MNDDRPLKVTFRGERRWATWHDHGDAVSVSSAHGWRRKRCLSDDRDAAKKCAEGLFLEILKEKPRR